MGNLPPGVLNVRKFPFLEVSPLSTETGCDELLCRTRLREMLTCMSSPANGRGSSGNRAFLAFKLHRFLSGARHVYATLHADRRSVTLDGQRFFPDEEKARLYSTFFCRNCGQEFRQSRLAMPAAIRSTPWALDVGHPLDWSPRSVVIGLLKTGQVQTIAV